MLKTQASIVVDVKQALSRQSGRDLVAEIGEVQGVSWARVSESVPRLVLVDYDPKQVDTQRILGAVVRRGFDARLVDM